MFESNLWPLLQVIPQLSLIPFLSKLSDQVKLGATGLSYNQLQEWGVADASFLAIM